MTRLLPTKEYSGLTIVLQNPSRFDIPESKNPNDRLLSGAAGIFFENECLSPYLSRNNCDIRTADSLSQGLLPNTKCIFLLGEGALHSWVPEYKQYFLGEQRGYPLENIYNIPFLCSWFPQDCMDIVDYESRYNEQREVSDSNELGSGDEESDTEDEKQRHGKTARSNYRFWLQQDTKRCITILQNGGIIPSPSIQPEYVIYPSSELAISELRGHQNEEIFFDIETDDDLNITVFSFNFSSSNMVYTIPVIRYDYTSGYSPSSLVKIIRSLIYAFHKNTTVCHNGWAFDLFIMAWKYRLPVGPNHYDTLLAQHRIYPEAEKSLGHCMSVATWEKYHKDEGIFNPQNHAAERKLWEYNAKDVWGMRLVKEWQMERASRDQGLMDSINQANSMVRPYLLNSLMGITFDETRRAKIRSDNDRWMIQYLRMIRILHGPEVEKLLPTSSKSCVKYFHESLGYKVVARSKKTGAPSLDEKNMWKLKLKYPDNIMINLCLMFRQKSKESGMLKFNPMYKI